MIGKYSNLKFFTLYRMLLLGLNKRDEMFMQAVVMEEMKSEAQNFSLKV